MFLPPIGSCWRNVFGSCQGFRLSERIPRLLSFSEVVPTRSLVLTGVGIVAAVVLMMGGCSSVDEGSPPGAEELFKSAKEKFDEEDYLEAYEQFRVLTLQYQGSAFADDAQFYLGECQFRREDYILASFEYETLIRIMPTSEFVSNAQYQLAMCYYNRSPEYYHDQEFTVKAIDAFQAFLEYYATDPRVPDAEQKITELNAKLARKEYESGIIYMKMTYFRAATVSFDYVLEKYHDSPYAEPALLKKGESLFARRRFRDPRDVANRFLEKYSSSILRSEAEALLKDAKDALEEELKAPRQTTEKGASG